MGKIVTLSGQPGVGKYQTASLLVARGFHFLKNATTRMPEENDLHKEKRYKHLTEIDFLEIVSRGGFVWHAKENGTLYGLEETTVKKALMDRGHSVTILTWEKALELSQYLDALGTANQIHLVLLTAPEYVIWERLEKRNKNAKHALENFRESKNWPDKTLTHKGVFHFVSTEGTPSRAAMQVIRLVERF